MANQERAEHPAQWVEHPARLTMTIARRTSRVIPVTRLRFTGWRIASRTLYHPASIARRLTLSQPTIYLRGARLELVLRAERAPSERAKGKAVVEEWTFEHIENSR